MIFKNFFTNSIGILVSRIFGLIRDLLTASVLGANIYSDMFFVAFKLPNLFRRIFAEGAFTQSFIPAFINSKHKSIFTYKTFVKFFTFLMFISFIVTVFSGFFAKLIAFGFDDETTAMASPLVAINFYYLPLIFAVTFLGSLLQYKNHFATTAFSTALLNIALISSLLLTKDMDKIDTVYAMSYAVIVGGVLQLLTHIVVAKNRDLLKLFRFGFSNRKKTKVISEERRFFRSFSHAILGNSTPQISAFLDTWIASFLVTGSISYLYYANRIFQLPLAIFAIALSIGVFPKIAKLIKDSQTKQALTFFKSGFWFLLFLLTLSAIGGFILSEEVVKLLFERGAFTSEDTTKSSEVLQMYLVGLVPFGLAKLFSLWLYATLRQKEAAKIALFGLGANLLMYTLLVEPLGVKGLALASSIAGIVLLAFTIRSFGFKEFLDIIRDKKLAILIGVILAYIPILLWIKEAISVYL